MLNKDAADWTATIKDPAVVSRARPQLVALFRIVYQGAEEGCLQRFCILRQTTDEVSCNKLGRLLGKEDVAIDKIEYLHGHVFEPLVAHEQDDRHLETPATHQIDQRSSLAFETFFPPINHQATDSGIGLHGDFSVFNSGRPDDLKTEPLDRGNNLLETQSLEIFGIKRRGGEQKGKPLGKVHLGARVKALVELQPSALDDTGVTDGFNGFQPVRAKRRGLNSQASGFAAMSKDGTPLIRHQARNRGQRVLDQPEMAEGSDFE